MRRTFPKHESIDHWGNARFQVANINDERRTLACSKATVGLSGCLSGVKVSLRVEDGGVGDVEGRSIEFLEDNLCHTFPVGGGVPCGFCNEDWVLSRFDLHNTLQCMANEWSYWVKILN